MAYMDVPPAESPKRLDHTETRRLIAVKRLSNIEQVLVIDLAFVYSSQRGKIVRRPSRRYQSITHLKWSENPIV